MNKMWTIMEWSSLQRKEVKPKGLIRLDAWFLFTKVLTNILRSFGWCHINKEIRTFKLAFKESQPKQRS